MSISTLSTEQGQIYQNFIDGEWRNSQSGETFASTNPAHTSDVIGRYQRSTADDIEDAVDAAVKAQPGWAATPAPERGEILLRTALLLEQQKEELAALMTREMGKILRETRSDVQTAIDAAKYIAGEGRRAEGETVPSALPNKFCMTIRHPVGIVGIITPWNFPMAIPAWKTFPALLAGNAVILKPASDAPLLSLKLAELLHKAGLPAGVLNVVTGPGGLLGDVLVSHKKVNMISLTGSTEVGQHVAEICGRDLRRCSLELGGKNAVNRTRRCRPRPCRRKRDLGSIQYDRPALYRNEPCDCTKICTTGIHRPPGSCCRKTACRRRLEPPDRHGPAREHQARQGRTRIHQNRQAGRS